VKGYVIFAVISIIFYRLAWENIEFNGCCKHCCKYCCKYCCKDEEGGFELNRLKYMFWVVVFLCSSGAVSYATDAAIETVSPSDISEKALLWRISYPGKEDSYLLGTMHSEDKRILALVDEVSAKITQTNCLALELDLNPTNTARVMQAMFFNDGRKLQQFLTKESYAALIALLTSKLGLGELQINAMKPWAVMMLLSVPMPETGDFLDKVLYLYAIENNIRVVGLETPEEQIAVMDEMSIADQVALMETSFDTYDQMPEMFERLVGAYLSQDLQIMEALYDEYTSDSEEALVEALTKRLLNKRNDLMATRMTALFQEQACFTAVGALHLPGEQGLLNLFRSQGYKIEAVALKF